MPLKLYAEEKRVTAYLIGEIDHHGAGSLREEIDGMLERIRPDTLILDFRDVTFMDSSGIGLIMGRYKKVMFLGGKAAVSHVGEMVNRIFGLSGLYKIIEKYDTAKDAVEALTKGGKAV